MIFITDLTDKNCTLFEGEKLCGFTLKILEVNRGKLVKIKKVEIFKRISTFGSLLSCVSPQINHYYIWDRSFPTL